MNSIEDEDEIRSEDVRDFIEQIPSWIIRFGIFVIISVVFLVFILSWHIRYPTIVSAEFSLSSSDLPIPIIPKVDGKIERLFYHENDRIEKGGILAFIESTADHSDVLETEKILNNIGLSNDNLIINLDTISHLGELQGEFKIFQEIYTQVQLQHNNGFYLRQKKSLEADILALNIANDIAKEQLSLHKRDVDLSEKEFEISKKLYDEKVIALLDLYREESKKIAKEVPVKSLTSSIQDNISLINFKTRELSALDYNILQLESTFIQSLNNFKNEIELWKSKYLLTSPIDGLIFTSKIIQEQQMIKAGEELFYIVSSSDYSMGQIRIPQDNFGKVKVGQKVLIKFQAFPFQEYGVVQGVVSSISKLPASDNFFFAIVDLSKGLTTNSGRKLSFSLGMSATAEIVTEDLRLLERLLGGVRRNLDITQ
jgi:HlyD family secretion protein